MRFFNYSTIVDPLLKDIRPFVVRVAGVKQNSNILDVCCGTGDQVFHYAKKGVSVFGVDLNPNMIKIAQRDKRNKNADNIFFRIANASALPFGDDFFDCASISLALHEMENSVRNRAVSEIKRVVKGGGKMIFVDFSVPLSGGFRSGIINLLEHLAGKKNSECFEDYIKNGGLPSLMEENDIEIKEISFLKNGNVTVIIGEA